MNTITRVIPHGLGLINVKENALIREWGNEAFGGLEVCKAFTYQCGADYCVLVYREDEFVGFSAVSKREVRIDGDTVSMGCVGGVITCPEHRGMGYGTLMMNEVMRLIYSTLDCEIGGLLCVKPTVAFYERLGWRRSCEAALIEHDGDKVEWPEAFMYHTESDRKQYDREIDLCGLPW